MLLTSVDRLRYYLATEDNVTLNSPKDLRDLVQWVGSVSSKITKYCDRDFELKEVIEYFNTDTSKLFYSVTNYPITSINYVASDSTGLFDGTTEGSESDYYPSTKADGIVLGYPVSPAQRGLKTSYIGGLAKHPTQTKLRLKPSYGAFTVGKFIQGQSTYTFGKIIDVTSDTLTIEIYYGIFSENETLKQFTSEKVIDPALIQGDILEFIDRALCEVAPDLVNAAEMEIRYLRQHKHDFENSGTNKDGTSLRRTPYFENYTFQPEVKGLLQPYVRLNLGY